jgi:PAS domain S-box-containing protein
MPNQADAKRTVRAAIFNFKPLVYSDHDGAPQGFFVKMLDRIAERENWDVQYVPGTWQDGLDRLAKNQVDIIMCVGYTQDRTRFLDFPEEFLVLDWGLVYKPKGSNVNTIMDLAGKTVYGLKGSVFSSGFLELVRQFQIRVKFVEADQVSDVFKAVESGRADAGITSNIPGILNEAAHQVDRTPIIFTPVKLGFAVNKGHNADLVAALDRGMANLKADPASPYHHELGHLFGKKDEILPEEAYWVVGGISGVLVISIVFIVLLRRKVRQKTAQLDEQASLMKSIINGTTDAVFIKDTKGRYVVVNDEVVRLFNRPLSDILGWDDTHFFPAQEAEFLMANDRRFMVEGQVGTTVEYITLDRPMIYLATKGPVYDKSGKVSGVFGISRDITALKQAEIDVRRYGQLLKRTGEIALIGGWEYDLATGGLYVSELVRQIYGVGPDHEITLDSGVSFYAPEAQPVIRAAVQTLIASATPFDLELPMVTAGGRNIWVRAQGEAELEDGRVIKIFGALQDITERKQMEEQLRQSNEQLGFVLEGSQLGFWDWNMETGTVARNERWAEMLGYTLREVELTVNQWTTLMHPDDQERAWKSINDHLEGRAPLHEVEYRMLAKDGRYMWILDRARIVKRDSKGNPLRMSGTHTDVTERRRAEEEKQALDQQLQHAHRLESLGVLTGGIAHDFNNILAVIIGHCSLAKMSPGSVEVSVTEIERAAERAAELCRQMLAYAGKSQFVQEQVDLGALVRDVVKMLRQTISRKVEFHLEVVPKLPIVEGDSGQLGQIVMNLVINASEAIGSQRGDIRVVLGQTRTGEAELKDHLGRPLPAGHYLCLEVSDSGCGMDAETQVRIFEPFYTTKFTGRGLGMSAVLGIITAHRGALQLESEVGRGTTFRVYLPVDGSAPAVGSAQEPEGLASLWEGSGTVLLVEDEEQVRVVARSLIESFGFGVLEAANGKEALDLYQVHAGRIELVVTDMGMPVMDGHDLVLALIELDPGLPIVVSSGFGDVDIASRLDPALVAGMISKPYKGAQLREVLRGVVKKGKASRAEEYPGGR